MTFCIHYILIPGHENRYSGISLPMVRDYAQRTGAALNIITQRKFPDYPVEYEVMQVFEAGASYDWNMYTAPGVVLGEQLADPTTYVSADSVATYVTYSASDQFDTSGDIYFERNERDIGISDRMVLAHRNTHEIWEPLAGSYQHYKALIRDRSNHKIGSYALSLNIAKYGLKISGLFPPNSQFDVLSDERLGGASVEESVSKILQGWKMPSSKDTE